MSKILKRTFASAAILAILAILIGGANYAWHYWSEGRFLEATDDAELTVGRVAAVSFASTKMQGWFPFPKRTLSSAASERHRGVRFRRAYLTVRQPIAPGMSA